MGSQGIKVLYMVLSREYRSASQSPGNMSSGKIESKPEVSHLETVPVFNNRDEIEIALDDTDNILEKPDSDVDASRLAAYNEGGLLKSRFDELSIPRTLWVFRKAALYCFLSYTLNMLDGWQVSLLPCSSYCHIDKYCGRSGLRVRSSSTRDSLSGLARNKVQVS